MESEVLEDEVKNKLVTVEHVKILSDDIHANMDKLKSDAENSVATMEEFQTYLGLTDDSDSSDDNGGDDSDSGDDSGNNGD